MVYKTNLGLERHFSLSVFEFFVKKSYLKGLLGALPRLPKSSLKTQADTALKFIQHLMMPLLLAK